MILKDKTLLLVLVTILLVTCTTKPIQYDWKPASYKTVKAYFLRPQLIRSAAILGMANKPEDFFAKIKAEEGIVLSEAQIARISDLFTFHVEESEVDSVEDSVNGAADCFDPRHAIVYYNEQEEPVAAIVACFECGRLCTYPRFEEKIELNSYLGNFYPFFEELNMPIFSNPVEYEAYMDSLQKVEKIKK